MTEPTTTTIATPPATETVTVKTMPKPVIVETPVVEKPAAAPAAPVRTSADILADIEALKAGTIETVSMEKLEADVANLTNIAALHGRTDAQLKAVIARVQSDPSQALAIGSQTGLPNLCAAVADVAIAMSAGSTKAAEIAALEQELGEAVEREAAASKKTSKKGA